MNDAAPLNPYAPPAARLEHRGAVGEVFRQGKLVAMHREGRLPARCVGCNAAALERRIARTLYWSPAAWRWGVPAVLVAQLGLAFAGVLAAAMAFWPTVLVAAIAGLFIRRKFLLEVPVCGRHARRHTVLGAAAVLGIAAFAGAVVHLVLNRDAEQIPSLLVLLLVMLALGLVRSRSTALAPRIARLENERLWLRGTGKAFRDSLPEAGAT